MVPSRVIAAVLLLVAGAQCADPALASNLGVNGLERASDLASAPFPADGAFVLSWCSKCPAAGCRGFEVQLVDEQTAFPQVAAAAAAAAAHAGITADGRRLSWSSGPVASANATSFALPASASALLVADATYVWRVRLLLLPLLLPDGGGDDDDGAWSAPCAFDVAPPAAAWADAAWIGGGSELRADWALPAGKSVVRARAYAAGLGAFELFLNGKKLGDHFMDAGQAVYDQKALFVSFNVTQALRGGGGGGSSSNAVGARLGNSKWGYLDAFVNRTALGDQSGDASRCFRLLLVATLSDGTEQRLVTTSADARWSYRHGPIVYDHIYQGEIYDQRQEAPGGPLGWASAPLASFPAGTWATPAVAMAPVVGPLFPQLMPPVRAVQMLAPVSKRRLVRMAAAAAPHGGQSSPPWAAVVNGSCADVDSGTCLTHAPIVETIGTADPAACCAACNGNRFCVAWNVNTAKQQCFLRSDYVASPGSSPDCVSSAAPLVSAVFDFGQNMAGATELTVDLAAVRALTNATTLAVRLKHTEMVDAEGAPSNNYFPGIGQGGDSPTCSMEDWYAKKWGQCANQTDLFIFRVTASPGGGGSSAGTTEGTTLRYFPSFTYHGFRFVELSVTAVLEGATDGSSSSSSSSSSVSVGREGAAAGGAAVPLSHAVRAQLLRDGAFSVVAHRMNTDVQPLASASFGGGAGGGSGGSGAVAAQLLGKIFNATLASHTSNLWSIPTDCPQRERRGWMADAGLTASSLATFFDSQAFHTNFLRLIRDNQRKLCTAQPVTTKDKPCVAPPSAGNATAAAWFNGSVPDVVPFSTAPYGSNPGSADWQAAYPMTARALLLHYGERAVPDLADLWGSLDLFMDYLERLVDPATGLLLTGARGDWIPPAAQPFTTPRPPVSAFFHTLCVAHMAEIASAIGRADDAARYTARLAQNKAAYHSAFFNNATTANAGAAAAAGGVRCCYDQGSQTSNVMALYLGAVPAKHINATVGMLVASIRNRTAGGGGSGGGSGGGAGAAPAWGGGVHMDVGIHGTTFLFEVLEAHGQAALGLEILAEASYPSLGYMVSQGATTLWESWAGTRTSVSGGSSRNHIMFGGGANRFLLASAGGLAQDVGALGQGTADGWRRLRVAPAPAAMRLLKEGGATRRLPGGVARVLWRWREAEGTVEVEVEVPHGSTARLQLPLLELASAVSIEIGGGCEVHCDGASMTLVEGGDGAKCAAITDGAVCLVHADGERVLSLPVLAAGSHAFRAQSM